MNRDLWSIVLAAGAGRRLASLTGGVPKQFWRPSGGLSLLETTLARLAPLSDAEHTVVVVDRSQRQHVSPLSPHRVAALLLQPLDRGTATGALLALTPVLDSDPSAVVLLTPADQGIRDEDRFRQGVMKAVRRARDHGETVLFGAAATHASEDYGWIVPAAGRRAGDFRPVSAFVEKPASIEAGRLLKSGAVWNTMIVVARACTLQAQFQKHLRELALVFEAALSVAPKDRDEFFAAVYPSLQSWDFSRDLLTPARNLMVYTWPKAIGWSDLGTPGRLHGWFRGSTVERSIHTGNAA